MLHGVIRINGRPIVGYKIVREPGQPFAMPDIVFQYRWEVQREYGGEIYTTSGWIKHRYGDGAEILVSKVLSVAAPKLAAQLPEEEVEDPEELAN